MGVTKSVQRSTHVTPTRIRFRFSVATLLVLTTMIAVVIRLTYAPGGCLFGFIPISLPSVVQDFILAPDGSFIGE